MNNNSARRRHGLRAASAFGIALATLLPAGIVNAQKPTIKDTPAAHAAPASIARPTFVTLKLQGLDCPSCAHQVQRSLMGVAGVKSAAVSVPKQTAIVEIASAKPPKNDALTAAVKKAGFGVTAVRKGKAKQ